MKLSIVFAGLLATFAVAIPTSSERHAARVARREGRTSNLINKIDKVITPEVAGGEKSNVAYSSNWAGAVWETYPSGTFTSVTGTFTVPTPSGNGAASAWVGIDGDTCGSAILQTGIDFTVSSGRVSYDAWYEWFPDYAYDFSGISFKAGDSVTLTVTATSTKAGTAVIKNNSNGQSVTKSITSTAALCEENAEWIVEDFEEGGGLVPFTNFGTVTFTNAVAKTKSGTTVGPSGSTLIDIEQNNKVLTSVSTSGNSVTVKHT